MPDNALTLTGYAGKTLPTQRVEPSKQPYLLYLNPALVSMGLMGNRCECRNFLHLHLLYFIYRNYSI